MEAPDRIYFDGNDRACKLPIFSSTNIEYIRADAFIEKALKWMTMKECIDGVLSVEMIDEFKTYMEKE